MMIGTAGISENDDVPRAGENLIFVNNLTQLFVLNNDVPLKGQCNTKSESHDPEKNLDNEPSSYKVDLMLI